MITEKDLDEAIAECQGIRHPTANTCIKLASFLTLKKELYGEKELVPLISESEFGKGISGKDINFIIELFDETMEALSVVNPNLYASVLRKLN